MKVIFLDIDGVLNSYSYYENMETDEMLADPLDRKCVQRLGRIVAATGARLVLSSSWRIGWNKDPSRMDEACAELCHVLSEYHMEIFDRTALLGSRAKEIRRWLLFHPFTRYVILDDADADWEKYKLKKNLIKTDFEDGALQDIHVEQAISILNRHTARRENRAD